MTGLWRCCCANWPASTTPVPPGIPHRCRLCPGSMPILQPGSGRNSARRPRPSTWPTGGSSWLTPLLPCLCLRPPTTSRGQRARRDRSSRAAQHAHPGLAGTEPAARAAAGRDPDRRLAHPARSLQQPAGSAHRDYLSCSAPPTGPGTDWSL